ncbi:LysR family transcriptional regulator [Endozoicomonas atrinae]|uniref:LysR family transcriptional regulator n=1 Tax=Endozoicomonas atrinae TaxID=1333660 RepID=UPI003AFF9666
MDIDELRRYDLNLLVHLHVLLEECSVSRAARHLNLSQSAISRSLQRLREHFQDELFIRRPHGLQPTARALALQSELAVLLKQLSLLVRPGNFEPALCKRQFTLSAMDHIAIQLIPGLLSWLGRVAPDVRLRLYPWNNDSIRDMASGRLDLAINFVAQDRPDLYQRILCPATPVGMVSRDHPLASRQALTMAELISVPHVMVDIAEFSEMGRFDRELARKGLSRAIILETSDIQLGLEVAASNQALMIGTREMSKTLTKRHHLVLLELPAGVTFMQLNYLLTWHRLQHQDQGQCWFRQVVYEHCLALR